MFDPFDSLDRRLDRAYRTQNEFLEHPSFPVAALAQPVIGGGMLDECLWAADATFHWGDKSASHSERVDEIRLRFVDEGSTSQREVVVSTFLAGNGSSPANLEYELSSEREQLYDKGIHAADPSDLFIKSERVLLIDGQSFQADLLTHGGLWAARMEFPLEGYTNGIHHIVTIVAYGVASKEVTLTWIETLQPFVEERRRSDAARDISALQAFDEARATLPAGLDVHRELIVASLRQQRKIKELKAIGRTSVGRSQREEAYQSALWEAAIDSQSRSRDQEVSVALAAVRTMVEHMRELANASVWFEEGSALADAAIGETVAYIARGEIVDSQRAQEAWGAYRSAQSGHGSSLWGLLRESYMNDTDRGRPPALTPELLDRLTTPRAHSSSERDRWLRAWHLWADSRRLL